MFAWKYANVLTCLCACQFMWTMFTCMYVNLKHIQISCYSTCYLLTFNPNPDGYINWCCHVARSNIWPLRWPIGEREALHHATVIVGSSAPSLRKSYRHWGQLKNCLVCQLLARGVPGQGIVEEGVKGVKYTPMPLGMYKNRKKAVSRPFWLINRQKRHFSLKSTEQDNLPRCFLRNTLIKNFFVT
jgi:hypothetical protein